MVIEKEEDFKELKDKAYIDCNEVIAEYVDRDVDRILCSNEEAYTNSLIICNNDYGIVDKIVCNINSGSHISYNLFMSLEEI